MFPRPRRGVAPAGPGGGAGGDPRPGWVGSVRRAAVGAPGAAIGRLGSRGDPTNSPRAVQRCRPCGLPAAAAPAEDDPPFLVARIPRTRGDLACSWGHLVVVCKGRPVVARLGTGDGKWAGPLPPRPGRGDRWPRFRSLENGAQRAERRPRGGALPTAGAGAVAEGPRARQAWWVPQAEGTPGLAACTPLLPAQVPDAVTPAGHTCRPRLRAREPRARPAG